MAINIPKDNSGGGGHVDPTVYTAMVTDVKLIDDPKKAKFGPFLSWSFRVKDPVHDGEEVEGEVTIQGACSAKLSDKSTLNKWLAAMGVDVGVLSEGEEFDVESAVGSIVMINVIDNEKEDMMYSKVKDVLPRLKRKSSGTKAESSDAAEKPKEKSAEGDDFEDTPPPAKAKAAPPAEEAADDSSDEESDADLFGDFDDD